MRRCKKGFGVKGKLSVCVSLLLAITLVLTGISCRAETDVEECRELFEAGQYEQSKVRLQKLLVAEPGNNEGRLLLTKAELALGSPRDALENMVLLPIDVIKEEGIDLWYLDHLSAGNQDDLYTPLTEITKNDSKYLWSRSMLIKTALAKSDGVSLQSFLNQYSDSIMEEADVKSMVWTFASYNLDDPKFLCSVAVDLGKEYQMKLAGIICGLSDSDNNCDLWLQEFLKIADDPDAIIEISNLYLLQGEYEKGLDLICKLEKEQPLPVNSREFSAIKSSLLFDLPDGINGKPYE